MPKKMKIDITEKREPEVNLIYGSEITIGTFVINSDGGNIELGKSNALSGFSIYVGPNSLLEEKKVVIKSYEAGFNYFHARYGFSKVVTIEFENGTKKLDVPVRIKAPLRNSNVATPFSIDEFGRITLLSVIAENEVNNNFTFISHKLPIKIAYGFRK